MPARNTQALFSVHDKACKPQMGWISARCMVVRPSAGPSALHVGILNELFLAEHTEKV
jgi:hypothetical protein